MMDGTSQPSASRALMAEAHALGIDSATLSGPALQTAITAERQRRWIEENREAIEAHTAWIEKHGVPLACLGAADSGSKLGFDPARLPSAAQDDATEAERARRWAEENRDAVEAWNRWTDENELSLAQYRTF